MTPPSMRSLRNPLPQKAPFIIILKEKMLCSDLFPFCLTKKYMELEAQLSGFATRYEQLIYLNQELFSMIENSISLDLLARLLSTQLITKGEKHLLDRNRYYYKLLRRIIREGQDGGEFRTDLSVNEMVKLYAIAERALLYDWCICNGEYSLKRTALRRCPSICHRSGSGISERFIFILYFIPYLSLFLFFLYFSRFISLFMFIFCTLVYTPFCIAVCFYSWYTGRNLLK